MRKHFRSPRCSSRNTTPARSTLIPCTRRSPVALHVAPWALHHRSGVSAHASSGGGDIFASIKRVFSSVTERDTTPRGTPPGAPPGTQHIPYSVIRSTPGYTLRMYGVYTVVETEYARREEGYLRLGQYMDGANATGTAFAMTQPVLMCYPPEGAKSMQMYVGGVRGEQESATATALAALPAPSELGVALQAAGGELVAVLRFEGYITPETAAAVRKQLIAALQKDGIRLAPREAAGFFRIAQYGQAYSLRTRVNEMLLEVVV